MYHEMVAAGQDQYLRADGSKVKVVAVSVNGRLEIVLPDHKNEKGETIGHGGSITVRKGDYLVGKEDGLLFAVRKDDYAQALSPAPVAIPIVELAPKK